MLVSLCHTSGYVSRMPKPRFGGEPGWPAVGYEARGTPPHQKGFREYADVEAASERESECTQVRGRGSHLIALDWRSLIVDLCFPLNPTEHSPLSIRTAARNPASRKPSLARWGSLPSSPRSAADGTAVFDDFLPELLRMMLFHAIFSARVSGIIILSLWNL